MDKFFNDLSKAVNNLFNQLSKSIKDFIQAIKESRRKQKEEQLNKTQLASTLQA